MDKAIETKDMAVTPHIKLKLPSQNDYYDVDVDNENAGIIDTEFKKLQEAVKNHESREDNPHMVTKEQVGLGEVGNYLSVNKNGDTMEGNLTAPKFLGALKGNADTATKLATGRNLTFGKTTKLFDGGSDVGWSLDEIGAISIANAYKRHHKTIDGTDIDITLQARPQGNYAIQPNINPRFRVATVETKACNVVEDHFMQVLYNYDDASVHVRSTGVDGGANTNWKKLIDSTELATIENGVYGKIVQTSWDGVTEVGRYIDFHKKNNINGVDYDHRVEVLDSNILHFSSWINIGGYRPVLGVRLGGEIHRQIHASTASATEDRGYVTTSVMNHNADSVPDIERRRPLQVFYDGEWYTVETA